MQKSTYRLKLRSRRFIYISDLYRSIYADAAIFLDSDSTYQLTEEEDQAQLDFVYDQADHVSTANKEFIHTQCIFVCSLTLIPDFFLLL